MEPPHSTPATVHSRNEQEGPRQSCGQSRALPPHPAPSQAAAPYPSALRQDALQYE